MDTFTVNKLGNVTANSFIKSGGSSSQYLMADGSVSGAITFTETDTLQSVTTRGSTTTQTITINPVANSNGFIVDMPAVTRPQRYAFCFYSHLQLRTIF